MRNARAVDRAAGAISWPRVGAMPLTSRQAFTQDRPTTAAPQFRASSCVRASPSFQTRCVARARVPAQDRRTRAPSFSRISRTMSPPSMPSLRRTSTKMRGWSLAGFGVLERERLIFLLLPFAAALCRPTSAHGRLQRCGSCAAFLEPLAAALEHHLPLALYHCAQRSSRRAASNAHRWQAASGILG